jgi:enolase
MKNINIKSIKAREILDSKGVPTVEVILVTNQGNFGASVPSGVSTGKYEAIELRDKDGRGVKTAISNIEKNITPDLVNKDLRSQKEVDDLLLKLDGTKNKSHLGANAILPVSIAACRAIAFAQKIPVYHYIAELAKRSEKKIPKPSFNMIEGGKHAENHLAFQEFMVIPQKDSFADNLHMGKEIYKKLKEILTEKYGRNNISLSKEGAFTAPIIKISEALDFILLAAEKSGFLNNIKIAIDAAASSFYEDGLYSIDGKIVSTKELSEFYKNLIKDYPILSIEDVFSEEEFKAFSILKNEIGKDVIIIGDDLLVSNVERIKIAQKDKSCSGLLLKPNQIGTVSETIEAANLAKSYGWKIMVSNRAGETKDSFIADLAVGVEAEFIKSGAPYPKERMAKYNRLLEIEKEIKR